MSLCLNLQSYFTFFFFKRVFPSTSSTSLGGLHFQSSHILPFSWGDLQLTPRVKRNQGAYFNSVLWFNWQRFFFSLMAYTVMACLTIDSIFNVMT